MTVKGRTKTKKVKKVKVSKSLRAKVNKVLEGHQAQGTFSICKTGMVGSLVAAGSGGVVTQTDLGVATFAGLITVGANEPSGNRTFFNCLSNFGLATGSTVQSNTGLNFFTPAKILDAASILFNGKGYGDPYTATTDNLSTTFDNGTAAPNLTAVGPLKINVLNSYVSFKIKNVSSRIVKMEVWECTPKQKFLEVPALQDLYQTYNAYTDGVLTLDFPMTYITGAIGATGSSIGMFKDPHVDPFAVASKLAGLKWEWKKREMILAPQETCLHSIRGPKGVMDYSKLTHPTATAGSITSGLNSMVKGWSCSVVIAISGDQVLDPTSTDWRGEAVAYFTGAANDRMGMPVVVETVESYKIQVPEIVGFMKTAGGVGTSQMLNFKKPKFVFWNQIRGNGTQTAWEVANEQVPLEQETPGQKG